MIRLLKIELRKIVPYRAFWILLGLYVVVIAAVLIGVQGFLDKVTSEVGSKSPIPIPSVSVYTFPGIWHSFTFITGFFKIVLGVIIIILITNEYSYKTIRQNIIAGFSRLDFLISKVSFILLISLFATFLVFVLGLIMGLINSSDTSFSSIIGNMEFLLAYCLEVFAYLCFAFLIGFLVKRSGMSIGILLLYSFVIEPIVNFYLPGNMDDYMPLKSIGSMIDIPNTTLMRIFGVEFQGYIAFTDVLLVSGYTALFLGITYFVLSKRDL